MDMIGIDLHKRESQLCILAEDGTITERRIVTSRERFTAARRLAALVATDPVVGRLATAPSNRLRHRERDRCHGR